MVKWGSFTRAAEVLGYAQFSVTTQIQKLEEEYGVELFQRFGRRMQLTSAGESLLHYANRILELYAESREVLSNQSSGTITIGTVETVAAFYLPAYLQKFQQAHPQMSIHLLTSTEPGVIQAVQIGDVDFGLVLDQPFSNPDLHALPVQEAELVFAAKPGSRLSTLHAVTVHDLENENLIVTENGCTYRAMLLQALKESGVPFQVACEFGSMEAIKQYVRYGLGIALLPRMAVQEEVSAGVLTLTPFSHHGIEFTIQLIYHPFFLSDRKDAVGKRKSSASVYCRPESCKRSGRSIELYKKVVGITKDVVSTHKETPSMYLGAHSIMSTSPSSNRGPKADRLVPFWTVGPGVA